MNTGQSGPFILAILMATLTACGGSGSNSGIPEDLAYPLPIEPVPSPDEPAPEDPPEEPAPEDPPESPPTDPEPEETPIIGNIIEGSWRSIPCIAKDGLSSRITLIFSDGVITRQANSYASNNCSGTPSNFTLTGAELSYQFDSITLSSEGLETDLYRISSGYTLISIEYDTMCFSEGFYAAEETHSFNFVDKDEASETINFTNCLQRSN